MPPSAGPAIDEYDSPFRLKNLRALSHADTGAANSENVQLFALISIAFFSENSDSLGFEKLASKWKLGINVNAANSIPAIMTGLRPIRSDTAPKRTTSGAPNAKPTAMIT